MVALGRALSEIVRRHEALRTTIIEVNGQPTQHIAPSLHLELPVLDLRALLALADLPAVLLSLAVCEPSRVGKAFSCCRSHEVECIAAPIAAVRGWIEW